MKPHYIVSSTTTSLHETWAVWGRPVCPHHRPPSVVHWFLLHILISPCVLCCTQLLSDVRLCDPVDCSPRGSSVHGIFRQEYRVGCHFLLQGIFLTQGSNSHLLHLLHYRQILYNWAIVGSPNEPLAPTVYQCSKCLGYNHEWIQKILYLHHSNRRRGTLHNSHDK